MFSRLLALIASLADPRAWLHLIRLVHYYNYSFVTPRRSMTVGPGARLSPNIAIRNGERIVMGARARIGAHCSLWAGNDSGRITLGDDVLFGPEVFITASNYGTRAGELVTEQPKREADVVIGSGVWLGARVIVLPGVTIGDGCVVAAGSTVTKSLPAGSIAAGSPARVLKQRD